ncbi:MAG: pitrilysin family protein [Pseudomonadota bacterium]
MSDMIVKKTARRIRNLAAGLGMAAAAQLALPGAAYAVDIQTITSDGGIKFLLVEDYTVPLIALSFSFNGGHSQDAVGKEGTSELLTNMLDEGAGEMDSKSFQEALDDNGMRYRFSAGTDKFSGSVQVLKSDADRSFELLSLMLTNPRFDEEPIERMKATRMNSLRAEQTNPQSIAAKALRETLFDDHPYSRPGNGTLESMEAITRDDLIAYHKNVLARDNVVIGIVGAISPEEAAKVVDKVFGKLPEKANLKPVPDVTPAIGEEKAITFDTPQTVISLALPGLKRDDEDFYAAYVVNYILGGGSFSSRLYEEVREKRGLAYGAYSYLATYDSTGFTGIGTATRAERAQQTVDVVRNEITRLAEEGPTPEELEKAKKYIIGSYAISNLDTSGKIASVLTAIQTAKLGTDYIDQRGDYIGSVSLEDTKRVAKRLLDAEPTIITVGRASE